MARQYRTLEELRTELRAVLGFGSSGAAAGANQVLIDSHLRSAQTLLYYTHNWAHLRKWEDLSLGASQYLIDYPATADQDRVQALSVLRGGVWSPALPKGIPPEAYTTQDNASWPQRWEPYAQIQIWPLSDQAYTLRCFYIQALGAFTENDDRASLDDTAIMMLAKWTTKAHYRQPDAGVWQTQAETLINKLKAKSWGQSTFNPKDYQQYEPLVRPQTV